MFTEFLVMESVLDLHCLFCWAGH